MKELPFTQEAMEAITRQYPTPFHIYDEAGIRKSVRQLRAAFAWNEGFREYFAVKALPNPAILRILKEEGCGFDCASLTELMLAQRVGAAGDDILFTSNDTPGTEYQSARALGAIINLDDVSHIDFLRHNGGIPETVCCRCNPGGDFRLGNTIMGSPGESKFGMTYAQAEDGFRQLAALGARRLGLHAFLASNTTREDYYPALARELFTLAVRLQERTGADVRFIDLSGGIGIPYRPEEPAVDIARVGQAVRAVYEEVLRPAGLRPSIYTELGRFVTGPHGFLVTRVIHIKQSYKNYIGVDASACNLMRPAMYGAYHHITVLGKETCPAAQTCDVVGSLCENNDKFAVNRPLPPIAAGDLLVLHDTGAHGFSMGYNYNGKLRSAELLLQPDGSVRRIRRAETPADYFATLEE